MRLRERHIYSVNIYSFLIVSLLALHPHSILSLEEFPRKIAFTSHHERVLAVLAQISNRLINWFFLDYESESVMSRKWVLFVNTAFGWISLHRLTALMLDPASQVPKTSQTGGYLPKEWCSCAQLHDSLKSFW